MSVLPTRAVHVALSVLLALSGQAAHGAGLEPIHAEFVSGAGQSGIQSVHMTIDGQDVTAHSTIDALRVAYTPTEKLAPGSHVAKVVVIDSLGRTFAKEWTFEVASDMPEITAFFTTALLIDLDALPRSVSIPALTVRGVTQPGAEVELRLGGDLVERVLADASGRFTTSLDLVEGENEITASASRPDSGEQGAELTRRVELVVATTTKPPVTEPPAVDARPRTSPDPVARPVERPAIETPPELVIPTPPVETHPRPRPADDPVARPVERPAIEAPPELVIPTPPVETHPRPRPSDDPVARPVERPAIEAPPELVIPVPPVETHPRPRPSDDPVAAHESVPALDPIEITPPPAAEVVITKPDDGDTLHSDHATVLGRAPAGWDVTLLVDGEISGSDHANPAGHFTIPNVHLTGGDRELVAEATSPSGVIARSAAVVVHVGVGLPLRNTSLTLLSPARPTMTVRGALHVEGLAWDGAEIEVEVNGDVVATEIAAVSGRFSVDVPIAGGGNLVAVEAHSFDGARSERSDVFMITSQGASRPPRLVTPDPLPPRRVPTFPSRPAGAGIRARP